MNGGGTGVVRLAVLGLISAGLTACVGHPVNERVMLGAREPTASFSAGISVVENDQQARPRSAWTHTVVVSPTDGTVTWSTLRTPTRRDHDDHARAYGLFPSLESAVDAQCNSWVLEAWAGLNEIGRTIGEVVLMPYRAAMVTIDEPRSWSPEVSWKRTNQAGPTGWSSAQPSSRLTVINPDKERADDEPDH